MPIIAGGADERGIASKFAERAANERRKSCETAHSPDPIRTSGRLQSPPGSTSTSQASDRILTSILPLPLTETNNECKL